MSTKILTDDTGLLIKGAIDTLAGQSTHVRVDVAQSFTDAQKEQGCANIGAISDKLITDVAAAHNAFYRGKDLTNVYTIAQLSQKVQDNDFSDLYIGDYITKQVTINGVAYTVDWVFADFDYFMNNGDSQLTDHHIVMIPRNKIFDAKMNATNVTTNGYKGSDMWVTQMPLVAAGIQAAFGSGHVISHKELLGNTMTAATASMAGNGFTGATTGWSWETVIANIPNEAMVYGCTPLSSSFMDIGNRKKQLALFRLDEKAITTRAAWWLSVVASSTSFALVSDDGVAGSYGASYSYGVRPYFLFH